jgi:hypothetical protein
LLRFGTRPTRCSSMSPRGSNGRVTGMLYLRLLLTSIGLIRAGTFLLPGNGSKSTLLLRSDRLRALMNGMFSSQAAVWNLSKRMRTQGCGPSSRGRAHTDSPQRILRRRFPSIARSRYFFARVVFRAFGRIRAPPRAPIILPISVRVAPSDASERTSNSIETDLSATSIFATRD